MKERIRRPAAPVRRTAGLIHTELVDETVVYDTERHQAHTLNRVAARVWKACDGQRDVADITRVVSEELGSMVDERVVRLALEQLRDTHLLNGPVGPTWAMPRLTRRELAQLGAIAAIPLIASVLVPPASAQASGSPPSTSGAGPDNSGGG